MNWIRPEVVAREHVTAPLDFLEAADAIEKVHGFLNAARARREEAASLNLPRRWAQAMATQWGKGHVELEGLPP